jgi:hypothetical protein
MSHGKRFWIKGKLAPWDNCSFPILEKLQAVTYKLELLPSLVGVQNVFYVSQLKKCLKEPTDVIINDVSPLEVDLSYLEHTGKLLDLQYRVTR